MGGKNCRGGSCRVPQRSAPAPAPAPRSQPQQQPPPLTPEVMPQAGQRFTIPQEDLSLWEQFKKFMKGTDPSLLNVPMYEQDQMTALQSLLSGGLGDIGQLRQSPIQPLDFGPLEDQARRDFQQKTIPSIAERFSALGAQKSSAFPQLLSQAGSNLETDLAAMRSNYNLSARDRQQNLAMGMLGAGLSPRSYVNYIPGQPGAGEMLGKEALQAGASYAMGGVPGLAAYGVDAARRGYNYMTTPSNKTGTPLTRPNEFGNLSMFRT